MTNSVKSLTINVTASATWTQLKEEVSAAAYTVPSTGRADVKSLIVANLSGSNSAVIEFAISPDNTPTDAEHGLPGCTLDFGEHAEYDGVITIVEAKGLWVKATGTSPNITVRCAIYEVVP